MKLKEYIDNRIKVVINEDNIKLDRYKFGTLAHKANALKTWLIEYKYKKKSEDALDGLRLAYFTCIDMEKILHKNIQEMKTILQQTGFIKNKE